MFYEENTDIKSCPEGVLNIIVKACSEAAYIIIRKARSQNITESVALSFFRKNIRERLELADFENEKQKETCYFDETEDILNSYPAYKSVVEEFLSEPLPDDLPEEFKAELLRRLNKAKLLTEVVDRALSSLDNPLHSEFIKLYYFQKAPLKEVGRKLKRKGHLNELRLNIIEKMRILIFGIEVFDKELENI